MIDYKYQDLFLENSIKKNLIIKFNGGEISNSDIFYETMELTESICSDNQITFGNCEASVFKITIANINVPLEGKWITVSTILDDKTDEPFVFGTYKVASFKPTADRSRRELVAYDAIKDILSADMTDWYNGLAFPMSLKKFRDSFFEHLGFEQEETTLTNDEMVVEKTIESDEISGKYIINAICEINGCFGHVNRNNKFQYLEIAFNQFGLYPRNNIYPADDLYPVEPSGRKIANNLWISCEYEDYLVEKIDTLQIRQKENDIGVIIGNGENLYVIQDNFLVYGKSGSDLEQIAKNTFNVIKSLSKYRPYSVECLGNPCIEVGDAIRIAAKSEIIESYVLQRTIKGIQSLRDTYKADGQKVRSQNLNSTQKSIKQLKGKTNEIVRTVEETRIEISDLDKNLSAKIQINANAISSEVTRATNAENSLSSRITQTAEQISLEVTRATNAENSLSSRITQTAESISLKVSKNEIISEINQTAEEVKIKANKISLDGAVVTNGWVIDENGIHNDIPFTLEKNSYATGMGPYGTDWAFWAGNGKYYVTQDGKLHAEDVEVTGEVNATSGKFTGEVEATSGSFSGKVNATEGSFDNVEIKSTCTVAGQSISGTIGSPTKSVSWEGNVFGNSYIPDLSRKKLTSCYAESDFGIGGSSSNCISSDGTYAKIIGTTFAGISGSTSYIQLDSAGAHCYSSMSISGSLSVAGSKNRIIKTDDCGIICISAYETATPLFGDVGKSEIEEDGTSIIWIDPIFYETVETDCEYNVFLTKYGKGDIWCDMVNSTKDYFIVKGTPGLEFVWEIKLIQKGLKNTRLTEHNIDNAPISESIDYIHEADMYIKNLEGELDYDV